MRAGRLKFGKKRKKQKGRWKGLEKGNEGILKKLRNGTPEEQPWQCANNTTFIYPGNALGDVDLISGHTTHQMVLYDINLLPHVYPEMRSTSPSALPGLFYSPSTAPICVMVS